MGLSRSKLFVKSLRDKQRRGFDSGRHPKRDLYADDEMLLPKCGLYNGYLLTDGPPLGNPCQHAICDVRVGMKREFRVSLLNEKLVTVRKGALRIVATEIVFVHASGQMAWPFTTLRWYAYAHSFFIFQCGRKAPTGEGTFIFSCIEYQALKETFELLMSQSASGCVSDGRFRALQRFNSHQPKSSLSLRLPTVNCSPRQFQRSLSMNASANGATVSDSLLDRYERLPDLAVAAFRSIIDDSSNVSEFTSASESTTGSDGTTAYGSSSGGGGLSSANYLNVAGMGISDRRPCGGEYLIAAGLQSAHGYVNESDVATDDRGNPVVPTSATAVPTNGASSQLVSVIQYSNVADTSEVPSPSSSPPLLSSLSPTSPLPVPNYLNFPSSDNAVNIPSESLVVFNER